MQSHCALLPIITAMISRRIIKMRLKDWLQPHRSCPGVDRLLAGRDGDFLLDRGTEWATGKCARAPHPLVLPHPIWSMEINRLPCHWIRFWHRQSVEETRHALNEALILLGRNLSVDPFLLKVYIFSTHYHRALIKSTSQETYLTLMKIDGKYAGSTFYKLEERNVSCK